MPAIRGIVCCVNYDDLLAITLHQNARHLTDILVVTHPDDHRTKNVVAAVPSARVFQTDAFYRYGARFNKGLAMEEAFEAFGRKGWILIFDADTLFPSVLELPKLDRNCLYGAPRLILNDPRQWSPSFDWRHARPTLDRAFPGYFQLFHASCPIIESLPWYDTTFAHAGGCDGYFESRWPEAQKIRLSTPVLHLGPRDTNWMGRASPRVDGAPVEHASENKQKMEDFLDYKGWRPSRRVVKEFNEKVDVPGAVKTGYKLKGRNDK